MKTFYVVSALATDSSGLGSLNRYETEKDAIDRAKEVIELRRQQNKPDLDFHILKVVAVVGTEKSPIKVRRMGK